MVIADSTMYKKHGEYTEKYILTIVNQVQFQNFDFRFICNVS